MIWRSCKPAKLLIVAGLCLSIAGGYAWWERAELAARYIVFRLAKSDEKDLPYWLDKIRSFPDNTLPRLLSLLRRDDSLACANCGWVLNSLGEECGLNSEKSTTLLVDLAEQMVSYSRHGQNTAIELTTQFSSRASPGSDQAGEPALAAMSRVLKAGIAIDEEEFRRRALELAANLLLRHRPSEDLKQSVRELLRTCVSDSREEFRLEAIRFVSKFGSAANTQDLPRLVLPLLGDPVAEVRRAALLLVGSAPEIASTDDLLPWLHDPDPEARKICEVALRGRGLRDDEMRLASMISDPQPKSRLRLIDVLASDAEREPGVWLRKLSHDTSAAVRAAAIRAAAERPPVDWTYRLDEMLRDDPSPTVRQVSHFYLTSPREVASLHQDRSQ